jgi:hypothetical protein
MSVRTASQVQQPPCAWEAGMCRALQRRLPEAQRCAFVCADACLLGPGASLLLSPMGRLGTLQDLINLHRKAGQVQL